MKRYFKLLAMLLVISILASAMFSCNKTPEQPVDSDSESSSDAGLDNSAFDVSLIADGASEYTLVVADDTNQYERSAYILFQDIVYSKCGFFIDAMTDFVREESEIPAVGKEILIGNTNRSDTKELFKGMRGSDFTIQYNADTERLIILGGTTEATINAVNYVFDNLFNEETKQLTIKSNYRYSYTATYRVGDITVNGNDLSKYVIVIPDDADPYTEYAADNFANWLLDYAGINLPVVDDKEPEAELEILIGNTSRKESTNAASATIPDDSYILKTDGKKIVMLGNKYLVGAGASELANNYIAKETGGKDLSINNLPTDNVTKKFEFKEAKNAILMIGDGMGFNHINLALTTKIDHFYANDLPNKGEAITASQSVLENKAGYTDSAAAATALSTGNKTYNKYIGMNSSKQKLTNIREYAHSVGAKTGVLTTDVITGATPGGFLVHVDNRNSTAEIQSQIDELVKNNKVDYCLGSVGTKLTEEAENALNLLSKDGSRFFMMIEEGYIDKRSHSNSISGVKNEVALFNDVIAYVIEFVVMHPDTALIVTADHETGGLVPDDKGSYKFTSDNHTNVNVGVFAIGGGTEYFNGNTVDNTDIPKFIAKIFGNNSFGK